MRLIISVLFISVSHLGYTQTNKSVEASTDFIGNNFFIVYESWMNLKVDEQNGEDLKSKTYGSSYYGKCAREYPEWKDKTTIAKQTMYIDLRVENESNSTWKVNEIVLTVADYKKLGKSDVKTGEWRYGTRAEEDEIEMVIQSPERPSYYIPTNIVFLPGNEGSSYLNLTVEVGDDLKEQNAVLSYKISMSLTEVGSGKQLTLTPEKTYYIFTD